MNNMKKTLEFRSGIVTVALSLAALLLFFLSYKTGYYIFGQMQSSFIAALLGAGILVAAAAVILRAKLPNALWTKLLTFCVTALLAAAAILLLGDRVEGIGNCILTDYDSGHGGEEAIYMSLGAVILLLIAVIFNIIGSFDKGKEGSKGGRIAFYAIGCLLLAAVLIPSLSMGGLLGRSASVPGSAGGVSTASGVYKISYNQGNENVEDMPDFQFLCSDLSGMVRADSRFYIDVALELNNGAYKLSTDSYVVEGGKRATIGDDTGLGLVLTTVAEGSYTDNGDGTVTINKADHAVFEMQTDTYSAQMKGATQMNVNGNDADGVYDSNDEPAVLDFVPATTFVLSGSDIVTYREPSPSGVFKISYNQGNENVEDMPDFQFLCSDLSGMVRADSRFYIDIALELNNGAYKLSTDSYVVEGGKRTTIGDDTGLGLVLTTVAEGSYTDNGDGTVTINKADHAVFEMQTDTYSAQMKGAAQMNVNGNDADGVYDSNDEPAVLDFVPATTFVLSGSDIVTYRAPSAGGLYTVSFNQGNENTDDMPDYQFLCSDLSGMLRADSRFYIDAQLELNDGAYKLSVDSYVVEGGKRATIGDDTGLGLVLTTVAEGSYVENEDGTVTTAKADHAVFEMQTDTYSAQMKGAAQMNVNGNDADGVYDSNDEPAVLDFVPETMWTLDNGGKAIIGWKLAEEEAPAEEAAEEAAPAEGEVNGVEIVSDDGGTTMTFYPTGTYQFYFSAYDISDAGSYTYTDGVLTLTDENGVETSADGDPIKLHYVYSQNDQLTGDYTIPAESLAFQASSSEEVNGVEIVSDDGGTTMTFYPTGTYQFYFSAYDISDAGSYTYTDGVLTLTDANGVETSADGDPIKLHYTYSQNDQLTGDYTIPAGSLAFQASAADESSEAEKVFGITAWSDDLGTTITLSSDGTYRFWFDAYSIEDLGTWQIADGILTLTDANGVESSAQGNPYKLHYAYSQSDQLTGDYTISADIFPFPVAGSSIPSKDLGTTISFFADGSYLFSFGSYQIVDTGSYVFEDGVLTLTDTNGAESKAEGDPLELHYVYSQSDQLTGDYVIPVDALVFPEEEEIPALTAVSDDHATTITLKGDGTYRFWFGAYEIEDLGTWQIADGVMTLVDANGTETNVEAAPYKLHYVYSQSDQLTGDYTLSVGIFPFPVSGTSIPSDDLGTTITFFADGSYLFAFDSYEIFDTGSYVFEDGVLTLTDANGLEYQADGETLKLHYGYSGAPDQLTGDFSIDPAIFG